MRVTPPRLAVLTIALASVAAVLAAAFALVDHPPIVLNVTPSLARGVYLHVPGAAQVGDIVLVDPPPNYRAWLLPDARYLLKRVAAVAGDRLCADEHGVATPLATLAFLPRRPSDLPLYRDCTTLAPGMLFLAGDSPDSLDSRYLGPLPASAAMERMIPLITIP